MQLRTRGDAPGRRRRGLVSSAARRRLAALLIVVPALVWLATVSGRHRAPVVVPMMLVASSPGASALLAAPPSEVDLTWSAPADAALSHVAVEDAAGRPITTGTLRTGPGTVLHVPVRGNTTGGYTVGYHVVGTGGGEATGSLRFAVGTARVPDGPAPVVVAEHEHGVDPASAVLLLANLAAVIGAGFLLLRRPAPRRRARTDPEP
jgi:methionine-rich copper-binding protein CopC